MHQLRTIEASKFTQIGLEDNLITAVHFILVIIPFENPIKIL